MGDADYGFVGVSHNKVTLYKGLRPVKKHIPLKMLWRKWSS